MYVDDFIVLLSVSRTMLLSALFSQPRRLVLCKCKERACLTITASLILMLHDHDHTNLQPQTCYLGILNMKYLPSLAL